MTIRATSAYHSLSWDETPYLEHQGRPLAGRTGTFVAHHAATMGDDRPHQSGYVVSGTGTGELKRIYGECSWIYEDRESHLRSGPRLRLTT